MDFYVYPPRALVLAYIYFKGNTITSRGMKMLQLQLVKLKPGTSRFGWIIYHLGILTRSTFPYFVMPCAVNFGIAVVTIVNFTWIAC